MIFFVLLLTDISNKLYLLMLFFFHTYLQDKYRDSRDPRFSSQSVRRGVLLSKPNENHSVLTSNQVHVLEIIKNAQ